MDTQTKLEILENACRLTEMLAWAEDGDFVDEVISAVMYGDVTILEDLLSELRG